MKYETTFSPDRLYRYTLWRQWWDDGLFITQDRPKFVAFIGLNPSTADETINDPTATRCIHFAIRWGYQAMCMLNLFAYRATDPAVMRAHPEPVGEDNDHWLREVAWSADRVIAAWGTHGAHQHRDRAVTELMPTLHCLRKTKGGFPQHPLYLPNDTQPILFKP